MFKRLDKEFYDHRPLAVRLDGDTVNGKYNAVWLIEGGTIFRTPTLMEATPLKQESLGAQEITDVQFHLP